MAKRQKTTRFSIQGFDLNHYRTTEQYASMVQALFDRATLVIAQSATRRTIDPDKPFSFDDYPEVKAELQKVVGQLASQLQTAIETGSKKQWLFACDKNDGFIDSIMDTSKLSKARLKKMQDRNLDALSVFQGRKVAGMDLSQRVWRYVGQFRDQLETALDVGLGEGRSAQQLARDVKQNLREPDRLFRRVRDKRGNLVLSKAARAFHPGQGVYRSSVKNAQRLTRSEINMAYRESDFLRWQQLDFVVGFEIHRSNHEPLCKCKMCDRLQGRYPKTFKFKGWHPQCMCYAVPILMDEETFDENELGDLKAALRGTEYKKKQSRNLVTDVPDGFKEWVAENMEASAGWASTPYFIKDNFVDGDLSKGLKIALPTVEPDVPDVPKFNYDSPNDALEAYIGGDMMWINQYLRGRGDFGELSAKEKQYLEELKRVTQSDVIGERTLWRSVDARAIFGEMSDITFTALEDYFLYGDTSKPTMQRIQRLLGIEGKEIIEKGFMSTTKDHDIAADWGDYTGADYPILMKIRTTANTRGVDVEKYTKIHNPEAEEDNPQAEILLNCNQRFRIVSVSKDGGNICVEVELIDEEQATQVKPKIDPIQAQLDALMPSIEAARKVADEWGLELRLKGLDAAVAARDVKDINKFISLITSEGVKYTAELSAFFKDAAQLIKDINAAGVGVLPDVVAELTQYMTNLSGDKTMWADGASFYQSELEKAKEKLREYKASPEARLTDYQKRIVAQVRESIKTADEWGIKTTTLRNLLDSFLADVDNYTLFDKMQDEMYRLDGRVYAADKKVDKFIADADALMKTARDFGIDDSELSKYVFYLRGRDRAYSWGAFKKDINKAFDDLKAKVDEAQKKKMAEEAARPKLDTVVDNIKTWKVDYLEVKEHAKQPTVDEIVERVGGGDRTAGSCSSLAFTFAANQAGLDVLDFRDGESRRYFARTGNIVTICEKMGGVNKYDVSGVEIMKTTTIGKMYYLAIGQHAAIVRQVEKGKFEYLELQSAYSNGWKPLNATIFGKRFGARGRCYSAQLIDIDLFKGDSSFKTLMGYINTSKGDQKKGASGTIK